MKWTASLELRADMERFFTEGLGCKVTAEGSAPQFRRYTFADGGNIGVFYVAPGEALAVTDMEKAPWLEFYVDDVAAGCKRLETVGVREFEYMDRSSHYFKAPGGVVFRLAKAE